MQYITLKIHNTKADWSIIVSCVLSTHNKHSFLPFYAEQPQRPYSLWELQQYLCNKHTCTCRRCCEWNFLGLNRSGRDNINVIFQDSMDVSNVTRQGSVILGAFTHLWINWDRNSQRANLVGDSKKRNLVFCSLYLACFGKRMSSRPTADDLDARVGGERCIRIFFFTLQQPLPWAVAAYRGFGWAGFLLIDPLLPKAY